MKIEEEGKNYTIADAYYRYYYYDDDVVRKRVYFFIYVNYLPDNLDSNDTLHIHTHTHHIHVCWLCYRWFRAVIVVVK